MEVCRRHLCLTNREKRSNNGDCLFNLRVSGARAVSQDWNSSAAFGRQRGRNDTFAGNLFGKKLPLRRISFET